MPLNPHYKLEGIFFNTSLVVFLILLIIKAFAGRVSDIHRAVS